MLTALTWLVALELLGLLALPLAVRVFRRLDDGGYGLVKPLGLLVVGYACWLLAILGLLNYTQPTVLVVAVLVGIGLWVWNGAEAREFLRARARLVVLSEVVFVVAYVLAVWVRANGAAINGQEKFMDMAIYHAFLRGDRLPTEDPWLAGYGMAYYYFGYFLWSLVAKVVDAPPAVGYNLALAGTLALLAAGVFGLAYDLVQAQLGRTGRLPAPADGTAASAPTPALVPGPPSTLALVLAALGAAATAVMGNLQALVEVLAHHGLGTPAFWLSVGVKNVRGPGPGFFPEDGAWWFNAARVIPNVQPDGITEFPWFSLILGDLHPHFVALPFDLLAVGLAMAAFANLLAARDQQWTDVGVAALGLGVLIPLNTWDVGTFWVAYAIAVGAAVLLAAHRAPPSDERPLLAALRHGGPTLMATFGLAILLYCPYFLGYQSQPLGLGIVAERTMLGSLLVLFGPFLVLVVATLIRGWLDALGDPDVGPGLRRYLWAAGLAAIVLAALAVRDVTLALLLALLLATAPLVLAAWQRPTRALLTSIGVVLLVCALGLLLGTELLFLRDTFGSRMNTVFKFHYHVWLLLGLLSPLLIAYLLRGPVPIGRETAVSTAGQGPRAERRREAARVPALSSPRVSPVAVAVGGVAVALAAGLMLAGLLYPIGATASKSNGFRGPLTLDGAAWLDTARPDDARAIRWLADNVPGRPVVAEAVGDDYSEFGRVSTFAGLPTLVGWIGHELQWRGSLPEFQNRQQAAEAIYRTADASGLLTLLQAQRVEYVYVGRLEADKYGLGVYDRFEGRLDPVYRSGDVAIYRVPPRPSGIGVGLVEVRP